jgi:hypothetical protein
VATLPPWADNMRQHDEASRATIFNLALGMWEAARTNRIFTDGFATQGEMYIMAVEVLRYTRSFTTCRSGRAHGSQLNPLR